jgi:tetratricopeptide (TPR) repeat protein/tRNA A-37 threonylcarbamoyl transferase component Bud32
MKSNSLMSNPLWSVDQSLAAVSELTDEQQLRLTDVLDRWLAALEHGTPLAQHQLLAEHPDLAATLQKYFQSLADLHEMAAGFGGGEIDNRDEAKEGDTEKRIGDFELRHEIGRGGMGVVYEARQISLDRLVAIKILPFASVLDSRQIARFKHEAQAAAQLHHPHIVPVFAVGVERGVHYYAMQLVNGQSLDQWIAAQKERRAAQRNRRMSAEHFANVARLGLQAAEALHAAHEYGIVHRDIKPSNLLIEPTSEQSKLWVTDFGLARMQREVSLTRTGDLIGTLRYMSPEQATGRSTLVDHRTDIYSLGATLYELATLAPAYSDENSAAIIRQIETRDPTHLLQLRPEMPADLANIIHTAMSRSRDDRYATAADLATDLRRYLAGVPTSARAPSLVDRVTRWGQRHARVVAMATSLLLLAVIGLTIATFLVVREQRRANLNLAKAQQSARDAREVLDRFGRQLSQRLAHVAGAEEVRRDLLLAASEYYRRFIADSQHDAALQTELAVAYGRLATLLDEVGTAEESLAAHQRAVGYLQQLVAKNSTTEARQRLAVAQNNLALALRRVGEFAAAGEQLQQAIGAQQTFCLQAPGNRQFAADLATSYSNLGLVQQAAGEQAAEASFQNAVDQWSKLLATDADSPLYQQRLAAAYNNLASVPAKDNPRRAVGFYQQALALQQEVLHLQPTDEALQRELAMTHHNLAAAYSRLLQFREAATEYRQAIAIQTALVQRSPAQLSFRRDLAVSYNNLGLALSRQKQPAEAAETFQHAVTLQEQLLATFPADLQLLSSLGSTLSNWGIALSQAGDLTAAADKFSQAIAAQEQALQLTPDSQRVNELLNKHRSLLTATQQKIELLDVSAAKSTSTTTEP